tara:strand:- start:362 stop:661 length:300 start_codon:yes stop_codon:yes gene_type:complete
MFKKIFYLSLLIFLSNCSAPGTAFLGPIFTGAKTGSVYQASLSYSTGKILDEVKQSKFLVKPEQKTLNTDFINKDPIILLSYIIDNVEISEVIEPEPLP